MTANTLRSKWISFFESKQHLDVSNKPFSPPSTDKSLLFINSGVAAIKAYFYGDLPSPSKRLVSCQKVIRTGDIDAIGDSFRHHTYFEMLGNFSIGDYFKKEAIEWGWEFLTKELNIEPQKLYVTIFREDNEAFEEWKKWIPEERIILMGRDTNFWDMGVGPCGPCTEIYYDKGEKYDPQKLGIELIRKDIENNRYLEIWNIVFSQFLNVDGKIINAPAKNIDTGAGLERLVSVLEGKESNFETSLFAPIIDYLSSKGELRNQSLWAPADYLRTSSLLVNDGISFGNKGREYVLRKIFRKALSLLIDYKFDKSFFKGLVEAIATSLPYYSFSSEKIIDTFFEEAKLFQQTNEMSRKLLDDVLEKYKESVPEEEIFNLVTRYGLDYSSIEKALEEQNRSFSKERYEELMKQHKSASLNVNISSAFIKKHPSLLELHVKSEMNYEDESITSPIVALFDEDFNRKESINGEGYLVLENTVIFPLAGGQDSDDGFINGVPVESSLKAPNGQILHKVKGEYKVGDEVVVTFDKEKREGLEIHHTLEHLLYELLKREVNKEIVRSSGVKYRDNFSFEITTPKEVTKESFNIPKLNKKLIEVINQNLVTSISFITLDESKEMGLPQQFEEVYKKTMDKLRLVNLGDYSKELCAGTHVKNTSQIKDALIIEFKKKQSNSYRFKVLGGKEVDKFLKDKNTTREEFLSKSEEAEIKKRKEEAREAFALAKKALTEELLNSTQKLLILNRNIEPPLALSVLKEIRSRISKRTIFIFNKEQEGYRFFITSDDIDVNKVFQQFRSYGWKCGGNEGFGSGMGFGDDFESKVVSYLETVLN